MWIRRNWCLSAAEGLKTSKARYAEFLTAHFGGRFVLWSAKKVNVAVFSKGGRGGRGANDSCMIYFTHWQTEVGFPLSAFRQKVFTGPVRKTRLDGLIFGSLTALSARKMNTDSLRPASPQARINTVLIRRDTFLKPQGPMSGSGIPSLGLNYLAQTEASGACLNNCVCACVCLR